MFLSCGTSSLVVQAQDKKPVTLSATYTEKPLAEALKEIGNRFGVKIFFKTEWLEGQKISTTLSGLTLSEALRAVLIQTELQFVTYDAANVVLVPVSLEQFAADEAIANENAMTFDPKTEVIGGNKLAPRNQKLALKGTVKNGKRNEPAIGANVQAEKLGVGTVTDYNGNYELLLPPGKHEITISSVGLETQKRTVQLNGSGTLNAELLEKAFSLSEVQVEAERKDNNVTGTQMGVSKLSIKEMKKLPALMGEVDVVKTLQLLPGVTTVGEAASGFNVRGGNTDQNLILLDETPVFNPTHLFGFFSVFNPDAVQDVTFYRGAIPAQLGGRLSAILDVKQKEGSYQKFQGTGGIGIVTGRLALEGPIVQDKISFLAAGRSTYSNWIFKRLPDAALRDDKASFYDGTVKLSALLSDKSKVVLSGYRSHDSFQFSADTVYSWATTNGSVSFNHIFSDKLILNATAFVGNYDLNLDFNNPGYEAAYGSGINQKGFKADLQVRREKQKINVGGSSTFYNFSPGSLLPVGENSNLNPRVLPEDRALESAVYVHDEIELNSLFSFGIGLRYSFYQNYGNGAVYNYRAGAPRNLLTVTDTTFYGEDEVVQQYHGAEPRFSVKFALDEKNSFKAGYSRTRQYMHVISNTLTVSPIDVWKTSNRHIKPQVGDQVSLGYFRNLKQNTIEASVEVYYKEIQNQLDYKDGAELFLNEALETEVLAAQGKAYGLELYMQKKTGVVTGWVSYAYSRSWLQTNSDLEEEKLNDNLRYPATYDKPHNLNLVGSYKINRRFNLAANFSYSTGRPFTASTSFFEFNGNAIPVYGARNHYRLPDYHRLDLSLTLLPNLKKNKKYEGDWTFSIYNVYARKNPYSVFYKHYNGSKTQAYQLTVIGTAIPSVTYNFKF